MPDTLTAALLEPASGPQILVVDDVEDNRNILCRRLERRGMRCVPAANGIEALELVGTGQFDLVLLDVTMPEMDGFEVLRRIRLSHAPAELPVVMVTALSRGEDILRALAADASDFVTKPIDFPVLLARLAVHLDRRRAELALRRSEERFALAVAGSNDGIWDWDLAHGRVYFSPRWKGLIGFAEDELGDAPEEWLSRVHPDDRKALKDAIAASLADMERPLAVEHRLLHRDGTYRWMLARGRALAKHGRALRIAGSQTDLTDRKTADPLTGLPNRIFFRDELDRLAKRSIAGEGGFALLLANIDRLRQVNDGLGLGVGDKLIGAVGRLLAQTVGRDGMVANLGVDEFAILLPNAGSADAMRVAERIQEALKRPFVLDGETVYAPLSIGIALAGGGAGDGEAVLRDAQTALRRVKSDGGARNELFDPKLQESALRRLGLERDLREALTRGEIVPFYQPIVRLSDHRIVGFEALARWSRPGIGMVPPGEFIPVAEETGLIARVDAAVLGTAAAFAAHWPAGGEGAPFLGVNLSAQQFADPGLVAAVERTLAASGLPPERLHLEITESAIMRDQQIAESVVHALSARRIGLAIDDFGTGYCSLAYLHRFRAGTLKIDRSFVAEMERSPAVLAIVRTVVSLAGHLSMELVAEGIETESQRALLAELGVTLGQGFLLGRPMPEAEVRKLLG
jgi:diguanylate cyclase (GGDEF)-like protein/PAS domain S-box-containing protein